MKRRQREHQAEAAFGQQLQTAQPASGAAVVTAGTADDSVSKNNRKKLIIIFMCLLICAILIFALSRMKYTTPEMRGKVAYEPALFNTVLLGNLVDSDVKSLNKMSEETYPVVSNGSSSTLNYKVTGEKIATSLDLSENQEFGNKLASESGGSMLRLAPGGSTTLNFTVTNGTTVADDIKNDSQDSVSEQSDSEQVKKKNVAQSDIRYTLHIRTTKNLPLNFELTDLQYNTSFTLEPEEINDDVLGTYYDYTVQNNDKTSVFQNGSRILKCNDDGSITVHRYGLVVTWDTSKPENTDLKYMKEIENIEVRLEVESYVNHLEATTSDTTAQGLIVIQKDKVSDDYYTADNSEKLFAEKTVRYDNLGTKELDTNKIPATITSENSTASIYGYNFTICNGESVGANWVTAENDSDGHGYYAYNFGNSLVSGDYGIKIGVPTSQSGKYTYYLKVGDTLYKGSKDSGKTTTTKVWKKTKVTSGSENNNSQDNAKAASQSKGNRYTYGEETETAYELITFTPVSDGSSNAGDSSKTSASMLTFDNSTFASKDATLYVVDKNDKYRYHSTKDDFRIYVYKNN